MVCATEDIQRGAARWSANSDPTTTASTISTARVYLDIKDLLVTAAAR
jgi:hypothetical protein